MIKHYIKQAIRLLRENKLLSIISILGTALAICMRGQRETLRPDAEGLDFHRARAARLFLAVHLPLLEQRSSRLRKAGNQVLAYTADLPDGAVGESFGHGTILFYLIPYVLRWL